ncbi:MAG TPA: hypothetical protein VLX92_23045 [Kofleriaceae bacterium]|nr:hypothetical protein [Kofleriaceae bacterium]
MILALAACVSATPATPTWVSSGPPRPGTVESVQLVVHRVEGQPGVGALAGALIGGFLFHGRGPATLFGMAGGAAIGAAASSGSSETHTYQVLVRFDDGERGLFLYRDATPFQPGQRVTLTPQGLASGG